MLIFISMSVVVCFGLSGFGYFNFKEESLSSYNRTMTEKTDLISTNLTSKITEYFNIINSIYLDVDSSGRLVDIDRTSNILSNINNELGVFDNIFYADKTGLTVSSDGKGIIPNFNGKSSEWYKRVFSGENKVITDVYTDTENDQVFSFAIPVKRNNQIVGVLAASVPLSIFSDFIRELTNSNQVYVYRKDGYILSSKKSEYIGKNMHDVRPQYSVLSPTNRTMTYDSYSQDDTIYVVSSVEKSQNWMVASFEYNEVILEPSNNTLFISMLITLVSIALFSSIIYKVIMDYIYKPLGGEPEHIEHIIKCISQGDLSMELTSSSKNTGIYASAVVMIQELKRVIEGSHQISENVSTASTELASVMTESEVNAQQETAQIEQIATAVSELSSTASEVSINASNAEGAASAAQSNVALGHEALSSSTAIAAKISSSVEDSVVIVNQLKEYSTEIGGVIDVINSISEQTNLLALNAAIEAARAGEQGRGFAVVADEVRSLAGKTQQSTVDIQEIIAKLQEQSDKADIYMRSNAQLLIESQVVAEKVASAFTGIASSVTDISDMNTLVAAASEEQSSVTNEIAQNINIASELVTQNVSGIYQSAKASEELSELSIRQKDILSFFKI
ncbi:methyl-accepting chemotaxis protein [Aliivibrio logei]|uniref:methyl-accepting chemotaxis protein n=1 Tax=Aliivibrio logei TaxID=688 RepID=UPI0035C8E13A